MNRSFLFDIVYALTARDGREEALFGSCAAAAREAFSRSIAGHGFPELWFEAPLAGQPWLDLHALASREHLEPDETFSAYETGGNPEAFAWFARQGDGVRQLALSWDTGSGDASDAAVQLLISRKNPDLTCAFLEAAGRSDAVSAYRAFHDRLPNNWFACYTGVFPTRPNHNLRVECIPDKELQQLYAHDADLLEEHLRQTGFRDFGDTLLPRCQELTRLPFQFEFQFDVDADGNADTTLGASVRFAAPPGDEQEECFDPNGATARLMSRLEQWGLADDRWHSLAGTIFSTRIKRGDDSALLYCYPAFVKLRWRNGDPLDAKTYLIAGVQ